MRTANTIDIKACILFAVLISLSILKSPPVYFSYFQYLLYGKDIKRRLEESDVKLRGA